MTEQHKAFSASTVFFQAELSPSTRRTASVGPGLPGYDHAHDEVPHPGEYRSVPPPLHIPHPNGFPSPTFYTRSASMDPRQLLPRIGALSVTTPFCNTALLHLTTKTLSTSVPLPPTAHPRIHCRSSFALTLTLGLDCSIFYSPQTRRQSSPNARRPSTSAHE